MEVVQIKAKKKKHSNNKLRVCAYTRVSTDSEKQETSFESQQIYYENKINNNPNWICVGIYSDKGISGLSTKNRNGFNKMIHDALNGKIDLILTKNISRFSRNTVDMLKTLRKLKENNVNVFFEEEMLSTDSLESELIITAMSSVAQMESEVKSERIRLGKKIKRELNEPSIYQRYFGYKKNGNVLTIKKKESKIVKEIFNRIINNESAGSIATDLNKRKIVYYRKSNWYPQTIKTMIRNKVYIGIYTASVDKYRKEQFSNGSWEEHIFYKHHEPIISDEIFEKANEMLIDKTLDIAIIENPFNNITYCGFCNHKCIKRKNHSNSDTIYWRCNPNFYTNYKTSCDNAVYVPDELIRLCFVSLMKKINRFKNEELDISKNKDLLNIKFNNKINEYNQLISSYFDNKINNYLYRNNKKVIEKELDGIRDKLQLIELSEAKFKTRNEIFKYIKSLFKYYEYKELDDNLFKLIISKVILGGYSPKGYKDSFMITFVINREFFDLDSKEESLLDMKIKYDHWFFVYTKNGRYRKYRKIFNTKLIIEKEEV